MQDNNPLIGLLAAMALPLLALFGGQGGDPEDESLEEASQITWLRDLGDREALFQIMEAARKFTQGLEAAEALAELGDVRGLDHLIAALKSPSSYLRHEAVQILKRLNHPRGLRALADLPTESPSLTRGAQREQLYEDLSAATTDELVAIWHENQLLDRSELDSEVVETILLERLGKLPRRDDATGRVDHPEIDDEVDPRVQRLWRLGDADGLLRIFEGEADVSLQLDAAEALADLGDEQALDFLIGLLDEPDEAHRDAAAQILDWLDLPRGKAALREHGFEFETDGGSLPERAELTSRDATAQASTAAMPPESGVAGQPVRSRPQTPQMPLSQAASLQAPWQQQETAPRTLAVIILAGAVGGVLGFMMFRLGLQLLGILPVPQTPIGWLWISAVHYLLLAVVVGAGFGGLGSRVAQALPTRRSQEIGEGDPVPVIGALLGGAISALAADAVLFHFTGL